MARLRAATWGDEEYWRIRISEYLNGKLDPPEALKPRVAYIATSDDALIGLIAGHLTSHDIFTNGTARWSCGSAGWCGKTSVYYSWTITEPAKERSRR